MVANLTQQRLLSFTLGASSALGIFISTRKHIWRTTAHAADSMPGAPPPPALPTKPEPLFGPGAKAVMVRRWNQTVDTAFSPIIKALSSRSL